MIAAAVCFLRSRRTHLEPVRHRNEETRWSPNFTCATRCEAVARSLEIGPPFWLMSPGALFTKPPPV